MKKEVIRHSAPWLSDFDADAVNHCLRSEMISRGDRTRTFENEFGSLVGWSDVKATTSGSAALLVAMLALDVGVDDEVIIPTYVCKSVMNTILSLGAKCVLCDVGSHWVMTGESVKSKITAKTKAIIVVHIFGIEADSESLRSTGVPVIEDCCQALGRSEDASWIGGSGDVAIYSFHPTKCLSAGEGGIVATNSPHLSLKIGKIFDNNKIPFCFSDIQASLALSQLKRYDLVLQRRADIAQLYFELLPSEYTSVLAQVRAKSMFFRFPLTYSGDFQTAQQKLANRGIEVRRGVDELLHRLCGKNDKEFPFALCAYNSTISIPILPQLSDIDVQRVVREVKSVLGSG
ncbi:DegT/DnrJ/EryC1/StrS family aminotransferase [Pseudomonadales bacterium]|nr:DegT/DnrJ/EryC1/StrS family aminotransferase [Pseudomonadales bacterium]